MEELEVIVSRVARVGGVRTQSSHVFLRALQIPFPSLSLSLSFPSLLFLSFFKLRAVIT